MQILFVLNDAPCGSERTYNALRLALALARNDSAAELRLFLMADAVSAAKKGQQTPEGHYNVERMLKRFAAGNHRILLCGMCMDARGLAQSDLLDGAARSTMDELARLTATADKALVF